MKDELTNLVLNHQLEIVEGNKIVEIKVAGIHKGLAARDFLGQQEDFIFAIGDDYTDEYPFGEIPEGAYTIKVGPGNSRARYRVRDRHDVRRILSRLL